MIKKSMCCIALAVCVLTFTSCAKKLAALDLDAAQKAVDELSIYGPLLTPDDEMLLNLYGIDAALIEKSVIAMPALIVHAGLYMIVLPKPGKEAEVKSQLDGFIRQHEKIWESYLPDQHKLVKDRLETTLDTKEGTYYVYIISEDNEAVLEAIKTGLK